MQNEDTIKLAKETKKELNDYRSPFEKDWNQYDNAYYGKQHKTGENVKTVKNHIFKIIESEIPILTDSMPGTLATSAKGEMQAQADILEKAIKWVYQDQALPILLPSLMRSALTSAPGYLYVHYCPDADNGDGKILYKQLSWKNVWLDGNAQTIDQAEKMHLEIPMRRDALARQWPEYADQIKKLKGGSSALSGDDDNYETRDVSGRDAAMGKPKEHKAKDILNYCETWVRSYDLKDISPEETQEEIMEAQKALDAGEIPEIEKWQNHAKFIEYYSNKRAELLSQFGIDPNIDFDTLAAQVDMLIQENPNAEQLKAGLLDIKILDNLIEGHNEMLKINPTSQEPKYKDGWRVIKWTGSVALYDGGNPEENGLLPLVPFYCYKDDTIYGFGEVKNIIDAQRTLNDMDFRELEGLRLVSNPGWIGDHDAEVDAEKLTNAPGIVVLKKRGTELRRLEPGQVSPQLDARKQADQLFMEGASGQNEVTMNGAMPTGNVSGVTVSKLQTQAVGRIRLKNRIIEYYSIKRLAEITASLILNNWTEEKVLRFRGDNAQIEELIFNPLELENLDYTIEMSPGSMAGVDKDSVNAFYMTLLQMGQITIEEFLMVAEVPKKDMVIASLEKRNAQAQQIEQLTAQVQEAQAQYEQQIAMLQEQNIKLKGALDLGRSASVDLLNSEERKVFERQAKEASINSLIVPDDLMSIPQVDEGATTANLINQGI